MPKLLEERAGDRDLPADAAGASSKKKQKPKEEEEKKRKGHRGH